MVRRRRTTYAAGMPRLALAVVMLLTLAAPAAASRKTEIVPGERIGPVAVGATKAELADAAGTPEREGPVWAYTIRTKKGPGVVKVLFARGRAKNVFTVDPLFAYRGVRVGTERDRAVEILTAAGYVRGMCGPAKAMFTPEQTTSFALYKGEVENIFVMAEGGACEPR